MNPARPDALGQLTAKFHVPQLGIQADQLCGEPLSSTNALIEGLSTEFNSNSL